MIEIVVVIALIAIITGVYIVVANPAGQLAATRNNKRTLDLQTLAIAIRQNIADQSNEQFSCASGALPTSSKRMASASGSYDIAPCLIPTYIFNLPFDPNASSAHYTSNSDYDTGYNVSVNSTTGQVTLSAPYAELGKTIQLIK